LAIPEDPLPEVPLAEDWAREVEVTGDLLAEDPCPEWALFLASEAYAAL
jgi:hypothetical protein